MNSSLISNKRFSDNYRLILEQIKPVDENLRPKAKSKMDLKTKPVGALGKLEDLALQLCLIQDSLNPIVENKTVFVFAGDHGISQEDVSAYPSEVTGQMVMNFLNGGAAINVLCRHHGIDIQIIDMGVESDFDDHPMLLKKKIRKGTRNFSKKEAMTDAEAVKAIEYGMEVFLAKHSVSSIHVVGLGEMGIGNTTAASAIISAITGISALKSTGRGTGIDNKGLQHKAMIIENAIKLHQPDPSDGLDVLRKFGGYEIAGIVGAVLCAASKKSAIVLDGLISTAAGLIAYLLEPKIKGYLISGHRSVERAQQAALSYMGIEPIINFNMRLGEGTGAAMAIDVIDAACKIMREMASFDDAGVSKKMG